MNIINRYKTLNAQKLSFIFLISLLIIQFLIVLFRPGFAFIFGAEYGRIAESIVAGNGYSSPFNGETGPTAWMLPLLVFILTSLFYLGIPKVLTFILLSAIKFSAYTFTFYFILRVFEYSKLKVNYLLFFLVFIFYVLFSPSQNFEKISDLWITVFFTALFIYAYFNFYVNEKQKGFVLLIIVFGLSPMVNPSYTLGFVFVVFSTFIYFLISKFYKNKKLLVNYQSFIDTLSTNKQLYRSFYKHLVFAFALLLSTGLWGYRNYIVFDKFIPSKSNMWFEYHLTNVVDKDGQLSLSTSFRAHPNTRKDLREEIKKEGEVNWIEKYRKSSLEYLESDFENYIGKVMHRAFNAFIFIENDMNVANIIHESQFLTSDKQKLIDNRLILDNEWMCFFHKKDEIHKIFEQIGIEDIDLIFEDWKTAKQVYINKNYSFPNIIRSLFMSSIPLVFMIGLFFISAIRKLPSLFHFGFVIFYLYNAVYLNFTPNEISKAIIYSSSFDNLPCIIRDIK